ncbi:antigen 5 like allergen Cul n 1 [Drosophila willistoni]|uniref:antigen 5 like allergen Cul n 1 n=1 Tax=Drosophila willistoni TaxID=7260 RepID=UPI00017D7C87|nr:antigen 5 like allergen Cul n 1 [Drosophila willistoni]
MIPILLIFLLLADCSKSSKFCHPDLCEDGEEHLLCKDNGKYNYDTCPPKATRLVTMSKEYINKILHLHNFFRNLVALGKVGKMPKAARMSLLQWDTDLANVAEVAVRQCQFESLKCASTINYPSTGQNEAIKMYFCVTPTFDIIEDHITFWLAHSDLTSAEDLIEPNFSDKNTSYFLQAVRDRADRIGCAAIRYIIPNLVYLLFRCVYSCGISMCSMHNPVYEIAQKTSGQNCRTGMSPEYPYLCSNREIMKKCSDRDPIQKPIEPPSSQEHAAHNDEDPDDTEKPIWAPHFSSEEQTEPPFSENVTELGKNFKNLTLYK